MVFSISCFCICDDKTLQLQGLKVWFQLTLIGTKPNWCKKLLDAELRHAVKS